MAEGTEISTPTTETAVTTSTGEVSTGTTSQVEVTDNDGVAENRNEEQSNSNGVSTSSQEDGTNRLYAGKYKSVEELEKGYSEAQKTLTQNLQIKAKYDELLKQQEAQKAIRLEKARQSGFDTIEAQEISDTLTIEEFNAYANALNSINSEYYEAVRQNLLNYYNTANRAYLDEAKRYFPSDFIEQIAIGKKELESRLKSEYQAKNQKAFDEREKKLAEDIHTDFGEFLSDIKENTGKSKALEMFCNAGFIQSKEDMKAFTDIYNGIVQKERENAIKEYEAQKAIEKTKQAATIQSDGGYQFGEVMPTSEQISKMSQADYNKAVEKWGLEKILQAK